MNDKRGYVYLVGLAFELSAMVLGGIFLGRYLGEQFGNDKIGALTGVILGFSLWLFRVIRTLNHVDPPKN